MLSGETVPYGFVHGSPVAFARPPFAEKHGRANAASPQIRRRLSTTHFPGTRSSMLFAVAVEAFTENRQHA